jgi:hypothetical protein
VYAAGSAKRDALADIAAKTARAASAAHPRASDEVGPTGHSRSDATDERPG